MTSVWRCDFDEPHDVEYGERALDIFLKAENGGGIRTVLLCTKHAGIIGETILREFFNGRWSGIDAKWRNI